MTATLLSKETPLLSALSPSGGQTEGISKLSNGHGHLTTPSKHSNLVLGMHEPTGASPKSLLERISPYHLLTPQPRRPLFERLSPSRNPEDSENIVTENILSLQTSPTRSLFERISVRETQKEAMQMNVDSGSLSQDHNAGNHSTPMGVDLGPPGDAHDMSETLALTSSLPTADTSTSPPALEPSLMPETDEDNHHRNSVAGPLLLPARVIPPVRNLDVENGVTPVNGRVNDHSLSEMHQTHLSHVPTEKVESDEAHFRHLMVSVILQNAKLRPSYPEIHPERVQANALSLVTDEWCARMMEQGKEHMKHLEERTTSGNPNLHGMDAGGSDVGGSNETRNTASKRTASPSPEMEVSIPSSLHQNGEADNSSSNLRNTASSTASSSNPARPSTPTGPRAMRMQSGRTPFISPEPKAHRLLKRRRPDSDDDSDYGPHSPYRKYHSRWHPDDTPPHHRNRDIDYQYPPSSRIRSHSPAGQTRWPSREDYPGDRDEYERSIRSYSPLGHTRRPSREDYPGDRDEYERSIRSYSPLDHTRRPSREYDDDSESYHRRRRYDDDAPSATSRDSEPHSFSALHPEQPSTRHEREKSRAPTLPPSDSITEQNARHSSPQDELEPPLAQVHDMNYSEGLPVPPSPPSPGQILPEDVTMRPQHPPSSPEPGQIYSDGDTATQETSETTQQPLAFPVPGLWFAKVGLEKSDTLEVTFDLDPETTASLQLPGVPDFPPDPSSLSHTPHPSSEKRLAIRPQPTVALNLLCLPLSLVTASYQLLEPSPTPDSIARAMWDIPTEWPTSGELIVQVNDGLERGKSWFPLDFKSVGSHLDVTPHIGVGINTFRLIQLGDLSNYMFILHASRTQGKQAHEDRMDVDDPDLQQSLGTFLSKLISTGTHVSSRLQYPSLLGRVVELDC